MEVILDTVQHWRHGYEYALTQSDPRVADWLLMSSYTPTLLLTAAYVLMVRVGPGLMQHREPFQCNKLLFAYNMFLVAVNFHIFKELVLGVYQAGYSFSCQQVVYSDDPAELRIAGALWWFYFSKLLEFMDTFFFILRKKNNQISFLHVYHHATMFPIWWIGAKWVAGGQSFFGAMINSFIHVLMYGYYGMSALGPQWQKYLWWKRYLTRLQLVQFVVGGMHAVQSLVVDCQFPKWMQWALVVYAVTILSLFLNFYFHAYVKKASTKTDKGEANGHSTNGSLSNGRSSNGVSTGTSNGQLKKRK